MDPESGPLSVSSLREWGFKHGPLFGDGILNIVDI